MQTSSARYRVCDLPACPGCALRACAGRRRRASRAVQLPRRPARSERGHRHARRAHLRRRTRPQPHAARRALKADVVGPRAAAIVAMLGLAVLAGGRRPAADAPLDADARDPARPAVAAVRHPVRAARAAGAAADHRGDVPVRSEPPDVRQRVRRRGADAGDSRSRASAASNTSRAPVRAWRR